MTAASPATVYLVDDDEVVLLTLAAAVESVGLPVCRCHSGAEFWDHFDDGNAGCLVTDVRLPGTSGLQIQAEIRSMGLQLPVIIMSGYADVPMVVAALKDGAADFFQKPVPIQPFLDAVQRAVECSKTRRVLTQQHAELRHCFARLTEREREVVDHVFRGLTNKQIAAEFGVSPQAIDAHHAKARRKLGVTSVAELVRAMCVIQGLAPHGQLQQN